MRSPEFELILAVLMGDMPARSGDGRDMLDKGEAKAPLVVTMLESSGIKTPRECSLTAAPVNSGR